MRPQSTSPSFSRVPRAGVNIDQNNPLQEQPDAEQTGAFGMLREVGGPGRGLAVRRWLRASVSPLGVLAVLSWAAAGSAQAPTTAPLEDKPGQLEQTYVTAPPRKPPAARPA